MTANSCVSGSTYKAIPPSSCLNMVNMLVIMLGNETEVRTKKMFKFFSYQSEMTSMPWLAKGLQTSLCSWKCHFPLMLTFYRP